MKTVAILLMVLFLGILSGCTGALEPNSVRILQLDNSGQIMPGTPAILGGCLAQIGDNYRIDEMSFEHGDCKISMNKKPTDLQDPRPADPQGDPE